MPSKESFFNSLFPTAITLMLITTIGTIPANCGEINIQGSFGQPSYNLDSVRDLNDQIQASPDSQKYQLRASKFRQMGLHKEAVDDLNHALQMAPRDAVAYLMRGENYLDEGMYPEAISDLSEAIKIDPKLLEAYAARASAYNKTKKFNNALADANMVLQLNSTSAFGFFLKGIAYDGMKDYTEADAACTKAIAINKDLSSAYYYRAYANQNLGNYQKAVDDYSKALESRPGYRSALLGRAWSYYNLGEFDKAVADSSRAVRFNESTLIALNNYTGEKSTEDTIVPDSEYLLGARIDDDLKNVIKLYDDILRKQPGDTDALRDRGIAYMHLSKFDDAIKDFETANSEASVSGSDFPGFGSEADYNAAKVIYQQGNKLLLAGNYAQAAAQYQQALKQYPQYAKCWHNLGIAFGYCNQFFNAELCCIKALSYRPNDWKLWDTLGFELFNEYQHDKGDPQKLDAARSALKHSLALHPSDEGDKKDVETLLAKVDTYERALCPANYVVITTMPMN